MAVFWFGWTKKLKNIFTKKEADALYLQKGQTDLQVVNSLVDFKNNIVCKQNGYVDNVDPNGPTSMINKRYLEQQLSTTKNQIRGEGNVWTGGNTFNSSVTINSGDLDFQWSSNRNWNQNVDNTVLKTRDMKWVRIFEYINNIQQPTNSWNTTSWNWTLADLNANYGVYEIMIVLSYQDNVAVTLRGDVVWKQGLTESRSQVVTIEKNSRIFSFQFVIKGGNKLHIYNTHNNQGNSANISWVRGWIKRGITFPTKMNQQW